MAGAHAQTNSASTNHKLFQKKQRSFSGIIRVWEICGVRGLVVVSVVVLHFNTQHINCQGNTEVFFTQIESNQSIVLVFNSNA